MRISLVLAAAAALVLDGCSLPTIDKAGDAAARGLYAEISSGADLSKDVHLDDSLKDPATLAQLNDVRRLIPPVPPTKVDNRAWRFNSTTSGTTAELTHAYHYADRTVLAESVMRKAPGQKTWKIIGFHVRVEGGGVPKEEPVTATGPAVKT